MHVLPVNAPVRRAKRGPLFQSAPISSLPGLLMGRLQRVSG
jgi:hypothetical protein